MYAGSLPLPSPLEWEFDVFLGDKPIGTHAFSLQQEGDALKLQTEATFDVKFLFFTAYTYRHRNTELWDEQGLLSIDAYTYANGEIHDIRGSRKGDKFVLHSLTDKEVLPGELMTFSLSYFGRRPGQRGWQHDVRLESTARF